MTAPEREALVKALRDEMWLDVRVKNLLAQAADMIEAQHRHIEMHAGDTLSLDGEIQLLQVMLKEALEQIHILKSSPAVTVTEDARNGDYSDDISPKAFETLRKATEGVNSSRLDRIAASPRKTDAVMAEALAGIEQKALHWARTFANSPETEARWRQIQCWAHAALKSTTPQTGSQE